MSNNKPFKVVYPGDATFDVDSPGWNLLYKYRPKEIMFPVNSTEVAACLADVVARKEVFRIRSGGHDVNGYSSAEGCIIIDLRHLDFITIDTDRKHVSMGPGVRFRDLYSRLADHKLAIPAGVCFDVAIGGHALGGGNGYLHRYLGASCDQVVGLKLIDTQGQLTTVTAEENPDLFWALRGAGNANFGIVVEYIYRTTEIKDFSTFALTWTWDEFDEKFDRWQGWAPWADTRLTSTFTLYKNEICAMGMFAGPKSELESLLPDFITSDSTKYNMNIDEYTRYDDAMVGLMAHYVQGDNSVAHEHATFSAAASMCNRLDTNALHEFRDIMQNSPGTSSVIFFARGGKICGVPTEFNAYRYRTQSLEPMLRTTWKDDDQDREKCLNWITQSYDRLKPNFEGVYKNWTFAKIDAGMYQWYGDHIPRLVRIKREWDPLLKWFHH